MTLLLFGATLIVFVSIDYFIRQRVAENAAQRVLLSTPVQSRHAADYHEMPAGALLHPGHTWLTIRENGHVRIGIDAFAADAIGKVEAVQLPGVATPVTAEAPLLSLKQGRREARFVSPVDGEVVATNPQASPQQLPGDWLVEINPSGLGESLKRLRIAETAKQWLREERDRLKDFLGAANGKVAMTLADGGEPTRGVLAQLDDRVWESFQREFLRHEAVDA